MSNEVEGPISIDNLFTKIEIWGYQKGIIKSTWSIDESWKQARRQFTKSLEEMVELSDALDLEDRDKAADAYGDIIVTLIMGMRNIPIDPNKALRDVYNIISKRTGNVKDGIFVKDGE